ncbi:MAG: VWA domain-containing protein, partial [Acidobacteria bacterium]|nr:VWA domain-containing protein [Acidobacteriota bacterium]
MTFANPLPGWVLLGLLAGAAFVAWHAYRRFASSTARRRVLAALRFVTLLVLIVVLMRPVARDSGAAARDAVVPVLVDVSRSMGIEDADRQRRIDRARTFLSNGLLPALQGQFKSELLSFGEVLAPATVDALGASGRRSDLAGALAAVRERYRGRPVAGVVLISDGGDTGGAVETSRGGGMSAPVYAFGVGSETIDGDREVSSVTAADAVLDDSRLDLAVSAASHAASGEPIELRLLENGRSLE